MLTRQIIQEWLSALTLMATIVFDKNTISINPFIPLNNYDPEFYDGALVISLCRKQKPPKIHSVYLK